MTRDDAPPTDPPSADSASPTVTDDSGRGDSLMRRIAGMTPRRSALQLEPGTLLDETYRIDRRLGAGGMGVVYLARDIKLERDVALKLHLGTADQRLAREARAIAQLVDPHVVTVHEIGIYDGHPFVAMEYLDGGTARTWIAERARSPDDIVAFYLAAGRGLAAAHRAGLVHRDFKPDNVLVGRDGRIRVADFGLVGAESAGPAPAAIAGSMTMTGAVLGTPAYMAPEQHSGETLSAAADQFAFCVSLWEALFGDRPFHGADVDALLRAIAAGPPRPPRGHRVPARILEPLQRGLAANPADRWPSMTALADALAPVRSRGLAPILAGIAAALVGGGAVAIAMRTSSSSQTRSIDAGIVAAIADANIDAAMIADAPAIVAQLVDAAPLPLADAAIVDAARKAVRPEPTDPRTCTVDEDCATGKRCTTDHRCVYRQGCEPESVVATERQGDEAMKALMYSHARQLYTFVLRCKPALVTKALLAACKGRDPVSAKALFGILPKPQRARYTKLCLDAGVDLR